jgi:hypothetical protein
VCVRVVGVAGWCGGGVQIVWPECISCGFSYFCVPFSIGLCQKVRLKKLDFTWRPWKTQNLMCALPVHTSPLVTQFLGVSIQQNCVWDQKSHVKTNMSSVWTRWKKHDGQRRAGARSNMAGEETQRVTKFSGCQQAPTQWFKSAHCHCISTAEYVFTGFQMSMVKSYRTA